MATHEQPVTIARATRVDEELMEAMRRLMPQLSRTAAVPTADELETIVRSAATTLLIARMGGAIVGSLTLAVFRIPTGVRAWIEDVVVDEIARGKGVGEQLNREALAFAAKAGARTVELTSRASREAANRLYLRLGFKLRETNIYRYTFDSATV